MFDLMLYKKRLQTVRAELVAIDAELGTIDIEDDSETAKGVKAVAMSLARLCRILVRVIDSLPGK